MIFVLAAALWSLVLVLVCALCAAARRGDSARQIVTALPGNTGARERLSPLRGERRGRHGGGAPQPQLGTRKLGAAPPVGARAAGM